MYIFFREQSTGKQSKRIKQKPNEPRKFNAYSVFVCWRSTSNQFRIASYHHSSKNPNSEKQVREHSEVDVSWGDFIILVWKTKHLCVVFGFFFK